MKRLFEFLKRLFSQKPADQRTVQQKFSESVAAAVKKMQEATPEQKAEMDRTIRIIRYEAAVQSEKILRAQGARVVLAYKPRHLNW